MEIKGHMYNSFMEVQVKGLGIWNYDCKKLTMAPKFLPGMMEGTVIPFPKKLSLEEISMV